MICIARSEIKAHLSHGIIEQFFQPLRNTFQKANLSVANHIADSWNLAMCVRAMNNIIGPEGVVSSALVFEDFPLRLVFEKLGDPKTITSGTSKIS